MRFKIVFAGALVALPLCTAGSPPVYAQSFLGTLFGFSKPAPSSIRKPRVRTLQRRRQNNAHFGSRYRYEQSYRNRDSWHRQSRRRMIGGYKTVCVRTCDGYYFPISARATRARFNNDARECQRRCGSNGALFYLSRHSDDISTARDLRGKSYEDLDNAFKYRKSLVNGCACRPMPWSAVEQARHRRYEVLDSVKKSYAIAEVRARERRVEAILAEKTRTAKLDTDRDIALAELRSAEQKTIEGAKFAALGRNGPNTTRIVSGDMSSEDRSRWLAVSRRFAAPYYHYARNHNEIGFSATHRYTVSARYGSALNSEISLDDPLRSAPKSKMRNKRRRKPKKAITAFSGLFGQHKNTPRWPGD